MTSSEYDQRYIRAGLDQLESYLLSEDIYWPIGVRAPAGETPYPKLTLGCLLLSCQRASAEARTPIQKEEYARLTMELDNTRNRWRANWAKKAQAEFHARLNLWRDFLNDYRNNPSSHYNRYTYEVGRRVMLQLLEPEADDIPETEQEMLSGLDAILRGLSTQGDFIWEAKLAPVFPKSTYWYLYRLVERT